MDLKLYFDVVLGIYFGFKKYADTSMKVCWHFYESVLILLQKYTDTFFDICNML